jgi:hypothetical protein
MYVDKQKREALKNTRKQVYAGKKACIKLSILTHFE